jgi:hypothetical protein
MMPEDPHLRKIRHPAERGDPPISRRRSHGRPRDSSLPVAATFGILSRSSARALPIFWRESSANKPSGTARSDRARGPICRYRSNAAHRRAQFLATALGR